MPETIIDRIIRQKTNQHPVYCKSCESQETTRENEQYISRLCSCGITIYYKKKKDESHPSDYLLKVQVSKYDYDPDYKEKKREAEKKEHGKRRDKLDRAGRYGFIKYNR